MPLKAREFRRGWKREKPPTDVMALQTLEGNKDQWAVLTTESTRKAMTGQATTQLGTMTSPVGVQPGGRLSPHPVYCANETSISGSVSVTSETVYHEKVTCKTNRATSTAVRRRMKNASLLQSNTALKVESTAAKDARVSIVGRQSIPSSPGPTVEQKTARRLRRRCTHCGKPTHPSQECFERLPEMKQVHPGRYSRWAALHRREEVMPGAFALVALLHPQLKGTSCQGDISRYMLGRVGLGHDLVALLT